MGAVRREGDWRLEKRGEGHYEITYNSDVQMKVYTKNITHHSIVEAVPVREVSSYSEAEGLFEEHAHGPSPASNTEWMQTDINEPLGNGDGELENLPPLFLSFMLLIAGVIVSYTFWPEVGSLPFLIGLGMCMGGLGMIGYGVFLIKTEDLETGMKYLISVDVKRQDGSATPEVETTPHTPEKLRHRLYYDRANRHCEHCGEEIDHPEVHHIIPRSEGGPNDPENLIVLCPSCHSRADTGALSKSQLEFKVEQQMEDWEATNNEE